MLRPPCKQQTISFESWNLNSARPKNSDWSWFGEKLARSNFLLIHPSITFVLQNKKTASTPIADLRKSRRRRVWCARRPWDPISICIGPRPRSNTIYYNIYNISNTELLQTTRNYYKICIPPRPRSNTISNTELLQTSTNCYKICIGPEPESPLVRPPGIDCLAIFLSALVPTLGHIQDLVSGGMIQCH